MANILDDKDTILDDFNPASIARKMAERMRSQRLLINITQKALSVKSGVSLGSIKRFENNYKISLENILQLALALNMLDGFNNLFPNNNYQNIDDLIKRKKVKKRKRASNG